MKEIEIFSEIESGNVCDVEIKKESNNYILSFAPSPVGGPECLWFYFQIKIHKKKRLKLVLKHFYNLLGGTNPINIRPVMRYNGENWVRLPKPELINFPDGRNFVLWEVKPIKNIVEIAFCYPYGLKELEKLLQETDGYWKKDIIGVSQKNRPIIRLSNFYKKNNTPGIYLIARQHSGETSGSWVLEGLLRFFAKIKSEEILVWTIPLSNIDGVIEGYYGKDNFPYDLNRAWGNPPMRHETLVIKRDIMRWRERCKSFLGIDFHAPGACENEGVYFYLPNKEIFPEMFKKAKKLIERIAQYIDKKYLAKNYVREINYKSRWETPSFHNFLSELKIPGFVIETPYALSRNKILTISDYLKIGENIGKGLLSILKSNSPES